VPSDKNFSFYGLILPGLLDYYNDMKENTKTKTFLSLMMTHQRQIHAYILGLVPNRDSAQDLMQETLLVMWSKFEEFESGSNFLAWGIQIARYKVLQAHWQISRDLFKFSPEALTAIERKSEAFSSQIDDHTRALHSCVKKLGSQDYKLVQMRYENEIPVKDIAEILNRSVQAVYKRFARINHLLMRCIQRTLKQGELA
jgi:RNA polymerase sigma-70 factor (ECF subfamily)